MIKKRKDGRDENNRGQHLEREDETERGSFHAQVAEHERRPGECETQQFVYGVTQILKDGAAHFKFQHEHAKDKLKAQAP